MKIDVQHNCVDRCVIIFDEGKGVLDPSQRAEDFRPNFLKQIDDNLSYKIIILDHEDSFTLERRLMRHATAPGLGGTRD